MMIMRIKETRWTQPDGTMGFQYWVYHDSGRKYFYNWKNNLPKTVLDFLLNSESVVEYREIFGRPGKDIIHSKWKRTASKEIAR